MGLTPRIDKKEQKKGKYIVYALVDACSGEIRYVGKSSNGLVRPMSHLKERIYNGVLKNTHLYKWVRKMLRDGKTIEVKVLETCERDICAEREIHWIKTLREGGARLCNATNGGEGCLGRKMSEKTKAALIKAHTGKKAIDEQRLKMSIAHRGLTSSRKGVTLSEEQKQKISKNSARLSGPANPFYGKKHTEETKKRISLSKRWCESPMLNKKQSDAAKDKIALSSKTRIPIICNETGEVFPSIKSAARNMNVFSQNIDTHLKNKSKHKHVGGFTFSVIQEKLS
jgi:group I intron endonuclease